MNQREKDKKRPPPFATEKEREIYADGAEYARRELFERLKTSPVLCDEVIAFLVKEYGL